MNMPFKNPAVVALPARVVTHDDSYWRGVGRRLLRDKTTLFCCAVLLVMLALLVLAPLIAPYGPTDGSIARRLACHGRFGGCGILVSCNCRDIPSIRVRLHRAPGRRLAMGRCRSPGNRGIST